MPELIFKSSPSQRKANKTYFDKNRDKIHEIQKNYYQKNKQKIKINRMKRYYAQKELKKIACTLVEGASIQ